VSADLEEFDDRMGLPEARLHLLAEGLIVQFHYPGESAVFLAMDRDVGRNFTTFINDCIDEME